jgi:hypothetical protein
MFGGGAKKEKKEEDEDRGDNSGSAKAQREAAAAAAAASKDEVRYYPRRDSKGMLGKEASVNDVCENRTTSRPSLRMSTSSPLFT